MTNSNPLQLFISYSHCDEDNYIKYFEKHITPLRDNGLIENWYNRKILPDKDYQDKIDNKLEDADIICLFISHNFLTSSACKDEIKNSLELQRKKGIIVIPIILSSCGWKDYKDISSLLALPKYGIPIEKWKSKNDAWLNVYEGLKRIIEQKNIIKEHVKGKVIVFIDAANLESSLKDLGWHMDYKRFCNYFKNNMDLVKIRFYSANFNNKNHTNFLIVLRRAGFKLVTKKLKTIFIGEDCINKANFDVEITLDARNFMDKYDTLVLFSGDSDFEYLIKFLRMRNKKVIVISSRYHISKELIKCCNKYIDLKILKTIFQRINYTK